MILPALLNLENINANNAFSASDKNCSELLLQLGSVVLYSGHKEADPHRVPTVKSC